jgi:hypothetical protein
MRASVSHDVWYALQCKFKSGSSSLLMTVCQVLCVRSLSAVVYTYQWTTSNMTLVQCAATPPLLLLNSTMQRVCLRAGMWQQAIALLKEVRIHVAIHIIHSTHVFETRTL